MAKELVPNELWEIVSPLLRTRAESQRGPTAGRRSQSLDGHLLCAADGHPMGIPPHGNGLRIGDDLLAAVAGVGGDGRLGCIDTDAVWSICARLIDWIGRERRSTAPRFVLLGGGGKTGPNPTDRRKPGSKHHVVTECQRRPAPLHPHRRESTRRDPTDPADGRDRAGGGKTGQAQATPGGGVCGSGVRLRKTSRSTPRSRHRTLLGETEYGTWQRPGNLSLGFRTHTRLVERLSTHENTL